MKINKIFESLHNLHFRLKNAYLVMLSLVIIVASLASQKVMGESVVPTVETKIRFVSDSKSTNFITNQNTLQNALAERGIALSKNDITDPPLSTHLIGNDVVARLIVAQPVLINDNGQSWVGKSAYTNTSQILGQLGVVVDKADRVRTELILDPITENMAGQKITIERAPVYTISVDSKQVLVHTWSKQVSGILADGAILLNQNDTVVPSRDDMGPTSGQIEVTRVNFADVEETVPIEYQVINQNNYEMYKGKTAVIQEGINGSKKQTLHIVYHNGVEVSREVTSSVIISSPQNKIVSVGVKPYGIDDLWPILVAAGSKYGVDPAKMSRVMMCESGGNQYSGAGRTWQGLFQWDGSFYSWAAKAGFPGADIFDVNAQIYATALRASQNGWSAWGQCQYK